ncbi:hypothetical protein D9619_008010 [Psilocybe cf. subviscida]|uniref:GPI transamidase component PIG-S n=1 Tax=Psilocybe cf. subviscida TaxID=2480587 RepID=A0A8H5ATD5_9AGAR|nr:hypothetical protein D9619_008010 [Psilocybe cf. subviscida]
MGSVMDLPPSIRNPSSLFYQKDAVRRSIIKSYWVVIVLALPLWWYTTSIERLALPTGRIDKFVDKHLELPVTICAPSTRVSDLHREIVARRALDQKRWAGLAVEVVESEKCSLENSYILIPGGSNTVSLNKKTLTFPNNMPSTFLADTLVSLISPSTSSNVVQYSPKYRLAFSLLNEDAVGGDAILDWDIQGALHRGFIINPNDDYGGTAGESVATFTAHVVLVPSFRPGRNANSLVLKYINPILSHLRSLHNFTVESQVQFYAPLAFSTVHKENYYGITPADLSVFVNSAEWTLSSSSSNDPVLHFVLFVPSAARRPLRILDEHEQASPSSAFLLPQWGGIVIHNSNELDTHDVFSSFATQLLALLGLSSTSDWHLDALTRRRTLENAHSSQDTLRSIVKLVDQIENMPLGADVKGDVEGALDALSMMYDTASTSLSSAFAYSAQSAGLASRAFFNPGMLALLYFPIEHTYAVYTPLFASALTPLAVAALREFLAWKRAKKAAVTSAAQ